MIFSSINFNEKYIPECLHIKKSHRPGSSLLSFAQVKLRNAAKSRLNRWMKPHTRNPELNAPAWLAEEWKKSSRAAIADMLADCNFDKD